MRNAIIMAAGTASRFVPLSAERPKGLLEVKGEVLIERQIRQLREAGVEDITLVVGYKSEMFAYLQEKYGVTLVQNEDYALYNNTSSMVRVLDKLGDTYVCCSDNYFPENVFVGEPKVSYYSALYAEGQTEEYCLTIDEKDFIREVTVGGADAWYMVGHVYFSKDFSEMFREILRREYENEETKQGYWEDVYIRYIKELPLMQVHRYKEHEIEEFDSLDELRMFDESYVEDTRSSVIKEIAVKLQCEERDLGGFKNIKHIGKGLKFYFSKDGKTYLYDNKEISLC